MLRDGRPAGHQWPANDAAREIMSGEWTVIRVRGSRGLPALDGAGFLSCVASIRGEMKGVRWHYRWLPDSGQLSRDGLRVELRHGSSGMSRVVKALEDKIPPPDTVDSEPLRMDLDLDDVQTDEEMELCLDLLWKYSDFLADLRARNPRLTASNLRDLTPGAFLTFVTADRRHLEKAMEAVGATNIPTVSFGKAVGSIREAQLIYHVPPAGRTEACAAARIHHLAGCTFASRYYPFRRTE